MRMSSVGLDIGVVQVSFCESYTAELIFIMQPSGVHGDAK